MAIGKSGRYSFRKTLTAWEHAQAWREKRRALAQSFMNDARNASDAFNAAWSNQITGAANLTAQAALDRIRIATALAKDAAGGVDKTV